MTRHSVTAYSYRDDPKVPPFDDERPLFVFDGHCGLCSVGVRWLMHADREQKVQFTSAQGQLGKALYQHFDMAMDETYLLVHQGQAWGMSGGYFRLLPIVGGWWRLFEMFRFVPAAWRDAVYRLVARNRYNWFGHHDHCSLLTEEQRKRLV